MTAATERTRPTTRDAIAAALPELADHVVVCANGYISRWAHALGDRDTHFYMIGSMGLASSIALGVATARPGVPVAVLDGDGNVLMNLGALPMIGVLAPERFRHVVLDNGVYASTGNQPTISSRVALEEIARAAGYEAVARVRDAAAIAPTLREHASISGPTLLLVETLPEEGPPAPRIPFTPPEMTARLRSAIERLASTRTHGGSAR
ncbi:MAG TPA: thiamine pyrophosphate-dependent enzyme [Candidatus Binatia bacterium]